MTIKRFALAVVAIAFAVSFPTAVWAGPILADVRANAHISGAPECDRFVSNGVLPQPNGGPVAVSCGSVNAAGTQASINSVAEPDGWLSFGGLLFAPALTGATVEGEATIKGDAITIGHDLVIGGFLEIVGRPSGAARHAQR